MTERPTVAIVIPVLNESAVTHRQIVALKSLDALEYARILWIDGGSSDGTVDVLRKTNMPVASTKCGRACQMNFGAAQSESDVIVFLHADTILPVNAIASIHEAVQKGAVWGRFDVKIIGNSRWLSLI